MKLNVLRKMNNAAMCVVCGLSNDFSLRTRFYHVEGDYVVGLVTGRDVHQSYPGRMHGGMITGLPDEGIGRTITIPEPDSFGVTSDIKVLFKKPVPLDEEIKVVGRLTRNTRLIFTAEGFIEDQAGNLLATGSGTYVKMPVERIAGQMLTAEQWFLVPDEESEIEIANLDFFEQK